MRAWRNMGKVEAGIMSLSKHLRPAVYTEWDNIRIKTEMEYRKEIPEVKVVEALKAWIDSQWAPPEEHARLWQEVLKAIRDIDERAAISIQAKQEHLARKLGRAYNHVTEKEKSNNGGEASGTS